MIITYEVGGGLYLNITNRCSNDCDFCVRKNHDMVGANVNPAGESNLWLEREPALDEILAALAKLNLSHYGEIVFCGFGEPTERLDVLLSVARFIRENNPAQRIRVNTNGHASLIAGHDVTPLFAGLIDICSVSLNYPNAADYTLHCRPRFGEAAWEGLLAFASRAKAYVPEVVLTVVDILPPEDIALCRRVAEQNGLPLRVRELIK